MNYGACSGEKAQHVLAAAQASGRRRNPSLHPPEALAPHSFNALIYIPSIPDLGPCYAKNENHVKWKSI